MTTTQMVTSAPNLPTAQAVARALRERQGLTHISPRPLGDTEAAGWGVWIEEVEAPRLALLMAYAQGVLDGLQMMDGGHVLRRK